MEYKRSVLPFKVLIFIHVGVKIIFIQMKDDSTGFSFRNEHPLESDQRFHRTALVPGVGQVELRHLFAITIPSVFDGAGKGKILSVELPVIVVESGVAQTITERIKRFFRHEAVGAVFHLVTIKGRETILCAIECYRQLAAWDHFAEENIRHRCSRRLTAIPSR